MKALVYTEPKKLVYQDVNSPNDIKANECIVDVVACGICGSDMHAFLGHDERRPAPLILGHEVSGIVQKTGKRVTVNPLVTCGECHYCQSGRDNLCQQRQIISMLPRQGGFTEQIVIAERNLIEVPEHMKLEYAAVVEPLACGWHTARLALSKFENKTDDSIHALVIGGGAIGVGAACALKAQGVSKISIIEPNQKKHKILKEINDFAIHESDQDLTSHLNFPIVIDCVGFSATRSLASKIVSPGGVIAHIGLGENTDGLDIRRMTLQEITFIGTYAYTSEDFRQTANALFNGELGNVVWIEERNLKDGAKAFQDILNGDVDVAKILLKP